jgi:hypothetical protein
MLDSSMLLGKFFFGLIGMHYHLLIDYDCRIIGMRSWVGGILVSIAILFFLIIEKLIIGWLTMFEFNYNYLNSHVYDYCN